MIHALYSPASTIFLIIGYLGPCPGWEHFCSTHNSWSALYLWYQCLPGCHIFTAIWKYRTYSSLPHLCLSTPCGPINRYLMWSLNSLSWPALHMPCFMVRPDPLYTIQTHNNYPSLTHSCLSTTTVLTLTCTMCALSISCNPVYIYSTWPPNGSSQPVLHTLYSNMWPDPFYISLLYNTYPGLTHKIYAFMAVPCLQLSAGTS